MREARIHLGEPPVVANIGVGVHGVASRTDVFRLPELWQLHLYQYEAELTVDGTVHALRPGRISLVPPGTTVRYRYGGRSEHLYAHLCITPAGPVRTVPVVQDTGPELPWLTGQLLQAIAAAPGAPERTRAEIWAALWRITELTPAARPAPNGPHPAVSVAVAHIRGASGRTAHRARRRTRRRGLPQPSDPALPRRDRRHGGGLDPPPQNGTRPSSAACHDALHPRGRRLGRHPRPPGLQQGLPPRTGRRTARSARNGTLDPTERRLTTLDRASAPPARVRYRSRAGQCSSWSTSSAGSRRRPSMPRASRLPGADQQPRGGPPPPPRPRRLSRHRKTRPGDDAADQGHARLCPHCLAPRRRGPAHHRARRALARVQGAGAAAGTDRAVTS